MTGKSHLPPVPPAGRAPQGGGKARGERAVDRVEATQEAKDRHRADQGREGEAKANLTNQRYQQDR
jgi:hypothetical protein